MLVFRYNRKLIALIAVGLLAAMFITWQRYKIEQANTQVELVMEYEQLVEMSRVDGRPVQEFMRRLKESGLTTLAVFETTLEKLAASGTVTAVSTTQMLHSYHAGTLTDRWWRNEVETGRLAAGQVYILAREEDQFPEVRQDLERRLGPKRIKYYEEGSRRFLIADVPFESLLYWNLGLPTSEMKAAAANGFRVLARSTNYSKVSSEDIQSVFQRIDSVKGAVSGIYFVGQEVLGFPNRLEETAAEMKKRDLSLSMLEFYTQLGFVRQEGMFDLAELTDYHAVRLHSLMKEEQPKLSVAEAVHRQVLGSRERNLRVLYLKMFERPMAGKNLTETHIEYVTGIKKGLTHFDVPTGPASTFPPYSAPPFLLILITVGAVAAGVLLISVVVPLSLRIQYGLLGILSVILCAPILLGGGTLARQATAFGSAVIFPVLAMTWQFDQWRDKAPRGGAPLLRILRDGLTGLIQTFALSMVGGLYLAAILSDVRFLLEMEIYRGVKMTFILPIILTCIVYLTRFNLFPGVDADDSRHLWQKMLHVLDYPAYIKTLLAFGLAGFVAYIFVGRSGHTDGVPVPAIEIKLRRFLETWVYARPREKEFLVGHPAFFMAVMAFYRNWPRVFHFALAIGATIGQGSLVETFAHMRTPILMSLIRGIDGIAFGVALGVAAVVGMQVLQTLSFLVGRRPASDE